MARIGTFKTDEMCRKQWARVSSVAELFERRWTLLSLMRVNPDLAQRLHQQRGLFDHACLFGSVGDIEMQGGGMYRGWLAAIGAMEEANAPDDAYLLGSDAESGLKVAIGFQKAAAGRAVEIHGQDVVWVTPDEVAVILANIEGARAIADVKRTWPGAEVTELRYREEGT